MPDRARQTFYELLEVRPDASFDEIETSYRGMLAYLGADSLAMYSMMEDDDLEKVRAQVDEAYRTLRDPERRAAYDRTIGRAGASYPTVLVPHSPSDSHVTMSGGASAEPGFQSSATAHRTASVTFGHVMNTSSTATTTAEAPQPVTAPVPIQATPPVVVSLPAPSVAPAPPPVPPVARIFEVGASATPTPRAPESPLGAILKRPGGPAGPRAVRRLQPKPDFEITPETEYSGALLRRLRESCNATLDDLGEITKVSKRYLRALEDSDFESLPAAVYVRGFVAEYARALGLDANKVCKSYMATHSRFKGGGG
jgi:hypothetical protein